MPKHDYADTSKLDDAVAEHNKMWNEREKLDKEVAEPIEGKNGQMTWFEKKK